MLVYDKCAERFCNRHQYVIMMWKYVSSETGNGNIFKYKFIQAFITASVKSTS